MRHWLYLLPAGLVAVACLGAEPEKKVERDSFTGMVIADGWETTRNNCIICHSAQQFLRQKGTRQTWTEILTWMKTQGLRELAEPEKKEILDYLTANYAPGEEFRRQPLSPLLMPQNPYESDIAKAKREKEAAEKQAK